MVGRKPWEISYQLGLSCPPPLKSPSSTQDLGPALTMYYYGGRERQGWGEGKEDKEKKDGERKGREKRSKKKKKESIEKRKRDKEEGTNKANLH